MNRRSGSVNLVQRCLVLMCFAQLACGSDTPKIHIVTLDRTSYSPTVLTASVGDTVVWRNSDFLVHTVTSESGGFDSGDIAQKDTWGQTLTQKGEFPYVCIYHLPMKGKLRVR